MAAVSDVGAIDTRRTCPKKTGNDTVQTDDSDRAADKFPVLSGEDTYGCNVDKLTVPSDRMKDAIAE